MLRPTRTRDKEMRKQVIDGYIKMESEKQYIFADLISVLKHLQSIQMAMALQGLSITTNIWLNSKTLEVKAYLKGLSQPCLPADCKYSWKEFTSQEFYNDYRKNVQRIRSIVYHFNY